MTPTGSVREERKEAIIVPPGRRPPRLVRRLVIDRLARLLVRCGGLFVILCVLAIIFVIAAEVYPLFRGTTVALERTIRLRENIALLGAGTDEHLEYTYVISAEGKIGFLPLAQETPLDVQIPGLAAPLSFSSSGGGNYLIGTSDGRAIPFSIDFTSDFSGGTRRIEPGVKLKDPVILDVHNRELRNIAFSSTGQSSAIAGQVADRTVLLRVTKQTKALIGAGSSKTAEQIIELPASGVVTALHLNKSGDLLFAGTSRGEIVLTDLRKQPPSISSQAGLPTAITVLALLPGDQTLISGDDRGGVHSWRLKQNYAAGTVRLLPHADFTPHEAAVAFFSASLRNKSFITGDRNGEVKLHYATSGKTLLSFTAGKALSAIAFAPKADAIVTVQPNGQIGEWGLHNAHPEISLATLFGKVWYEGREGPEYVWQSSSASDEVEAKLSLVPLIFGTIKGTFYALIFAVPLAVLAALYVSQFMHPRLKAYVKPAVELMAALPSVVIGFVAGLWLAPRIEPVLVGLFISPFVIASLILAVLFAWRLLPSRLAGHLRPGTEVFLLLFVVVAGLWLSFKGGDAITNRFFGGDFSAYLREALGLTYDQRNSVVVALAIGFAVIPLIFTITEDSLSAVPQSFVAASLALGATRWQTALRVVLPSASPAIFSAVMIGFGRAVGETMIVLMATGNTPLMDWSPFNGFRALSANIAVEMPEAPVGGSLYRVLFLTALILFVMTFFVNMLSEAVRIRLRKRYQQV